MSSQQELFDKNWKMQVDAIKNGPAIESVVRDIDKPKLALSSVIIIPLKIQKIISNATTELRAKYPNQFFYPCNRLHITVVGLINETENFLLDESLIPKLEEIYQKVLQPHPKFFVELKGLNMTAHSVNIQVFYENKVLDKIRTELLNKIKKAGLKLDYKHIAAANRGFGWSTMMRFRKGEDLNQLILDVEKLREQHFGEFMVNEVVLAVTNKYFSEKNTRILRRFEVGLN